MSLHPRSLHPLFRTLLLTSVFTVGCLAGADDDITGEYATKYSNQYEYTKAKFFEEGDKDGMLPPLDGTGTSAPAPSFSMKSHALTKPVRKAASKSAKKFSKKSSNKSLKYAAKKKSEKANLTSATVKSKKAKKPTRQLASQPPVKRAPHKRIYVGNLTPE